jgi:hypothetical protein
MKRLSATLFILASLFNSCSEDFDVVAPYKEVIVINGLLNASDTIQYIRVGKAFLGEGNAFVMAQQPDSVYYGDILEVNLERLTPQNQMVETIPLSRTTAVDKEPGLFVYPYQVLYTTNRLLLQDGSKYRIRVRNTQTGVTASSTTRIVVDEGIRPLTDPVDLASDCILKSDGRIILFFSFSTFIMHQI